MEIIWVLLASGLFGTTGATRALALPDADPLVVGALRLAIGGIALGLIAGAVAIRRRARPPFSARLVLAAVVGAIGVVAYQPAFFGGVRDNGVAVGTLLALGSAPAFTGLIGWLALRQRPTRRWVACTAVALVGIVLLSGVLGGGVIGTGAARISPLGAALSLGAGLAYAAYTLAVKALLTAGWRPLEAVGAVFGLAGLVGAGQLLLTGVPSLSDAGMAGALWLGLGTVTVAYVLFARGLEHLPASTVATATLAEPVVATVLGVAVLGERLGAVSIAGIALLVIALGILGARPARRAPQGSAIG